MNMDLEKTLNRREQRKRSQAGQEARRAWIYAGKITGLYAMFHECARKFAQIRAVNPRLFGFLRVGAFFNKEARKTGVRSQNEKKAQRRRKFGMEERLEDAGPEAEVSRGVVKCGNCRVREALEEGFGKKRLCSITRIYTHLHDFTQGSWLCGKWSVGVVESWGERGENESKAQSEHR